MASHAKKNAAPLGRRNTIWRRAGDSIGFQPICPSLASSVGRIPKNSPLGYFLNGIPPHRFESPVTVLGNKNEHGVSVLVAFSGGELGIRTPDTLLAYTRLAGEHLRPLGQLSVYAN